MALHIEKSSDTISEAVTNTESDEHIQLCILDIMKRHSKRSRELFLSKTGNISLQF